MQQIEDVGGIGALVHQVGQDAMASWSDERRRDFCKAFDGRVRASQVILAETASRLLSEAKRLGLVNEGAMRDFHPHHPPVDGEQQGRHWREHIWGGRAYGELQKIAHERAAELLKQIPAAKKLHSVLDAEVGKAMEERDRLVEEGKKVYAKLMAVAQPVRLSDLDPGTTVAEVLKAAERRQAESKRLARELEDINEAATKLEEKIVIRTAKGVPGVKDAIVAVVKQHIRKAEELGPVSRRVEERVQFGDSAAATELLRTFEQDEAKAAGEDSSQLRAAADKILALAPAQAPAKKQRAAKRGS